MELIDLTVTLEAKELLLEYMQKCNLKEPIASIQWLQDGYRINKNEETGEAGKEALPDDWEVGFYDLEKIPNADIQIIRGIKFVLNDSLHYKDLNGKILDVVDGKFKIANQ